MTLACIVIYSIVHAGAREHYSIYYNRIRMRYFRRKNFTKYQLLSKKSAL